MVRGEGRKEPETAAKRPKGPKGASVAQMAGLYGRVSWGRTAQLLGWRVQRAGYASQEDPVVGGTEGNWQNLAASIHTGMLIGTSVSQFVLGLRPNLLQALWVVFHWKSPMLLVLAYWIPGQASFGVSPWIREQNACPTVPEVPRLVDTLVIADRVASPLV